MNGIKTVQIILWLIGAAVAAAMPPAPVPSPEPATAITPPPTAATATAETAGTAATSPAGDLRVDIEADKTDQVYFGENITVKEGEVVEGDLVVTGGNLAVDGVVKGDVVCTGGDLTLGRHASVEGDVVVVGGKMIADPAAVVKGQKITVAGDLGSLKHLKILKAVNKEASALATRVGAAAKEVVFFAFLMFVALLLNVFVPRQFENAREHLEKEFPRCTLLGLAAMIVLPIAFLVLLVSLIGIPLIPVAFLILSVAALWGYVVFARIIGHRLTGEKPILFQTFIGLLLLQGASLVGDLIALPGGLMSDIGSVFTNIGRIIFIAGIFIGLGAVAYSRAGTWTLARTRAAVESKPYGDGDAAPTQNLPPASA